jgi:hypothetical protein
MNRTLLWGIALFSLTTFFVVHASFYGKIIQCAHPSVRYLGCRYSSGIVEHCYEKEHKETREVEKEWVKTSSTQRLLYLREQQLKDMHEYFLKKAYDYFHAKREEKECSTPFHEVTLYQFRLLCGKEGIMREYRNCFGILKAYCDFSVDRNNEKEQEFADYIAYHFIEKVINLLDSLSTSSCCATAG